MALTLGNACRCHLSTVHLAARSFAALPSGRFGAVALLYTAKCSWITDNCGASGQGSHSAAFIAAELVYGDQEMLAAAQLSRASRKPFALEQSKPHPVTIIACLCTNEHQPPRSPRAHVFTPCGSRTAATPAYWCYTFCHVSGDFPDSFCYFETAKRLCACAANAILCSNGQPKSSPSRVK